MENVSVQMPLRLRRWSGTASEGPTQRLGLRAADGTKLGFVKLETGLLYLINEATRVCVLQALADLGVDVAGPPVDVVRMLPWLAEAFAYPGTQGRTKLLSVVDTPELGIPEADVAYVDEHIRYRRSTGERLPPPVIGHHDPATGHLSICRRQWTEGAIGHLRRVGVLGVTDEVSVLEDSERAAPAGARAAFRPGLVTDAERAAVEGREQPSATLATGSTSTCELGPDAVMLVPDELLPIVAGHFAVLHDHSGDERLRDHPSTQPERERNPWHDAGGYYRKPSAQRRGPFDDARDVAGRLDEAVFDDLLELWCASLREEFGGHWATVGAVLAETEQPPLWQVAGDSWNRKGRPAFTDLPGLDPAWKSQVEYLASRLYGRSVERGETWSLPKFMVCPVCGEQFDPSLLETMDLALRLGPPRWCRRCGGMSWGITDDLAARLELPEELVVSALRQLAATWGCLPPADWRKARVPWRASGTNRDAFLLAAAAVPRPDALAGRTWTQWLQLTGLVGDTIPTARGTRAIASDGHPCRSLFELAIDDYFSSAGVHHECEPIWPWHATYNSSGQRRADWRLADGTYVEAVGMLSDAAYAARFAEKQALAEALGIRLIVVEPKDLLRLPELFALER